MALFGAAHGWVGAKRFPLTKMSHNDETSHSYALPKEDTKNIIITWNSLWVLLASVFFNWKLSNFAISKNTDIVCISKHNF